MSKPELLEKTPMNLSEVKAALEKIRETESELNFRAQKTEEYAQDFAKLKLADANELFAKLKALEVPRLREQHLHKLIDVMPVSEKHVKLVLGTYNVSPTAENCKKLADLLSEYAPKKH
jgi:DNA-directed RNA polymerase subunit F